MTQPTGSNRLMRSIDELQHPCFCTYGMLHWAVSKSDWAIRTGWTPVRFEAGQIIVLYPTDAHAPGMVVDQSMYVKKIVMKIAVGS